MKALTLTQPWATLVAVGAKTIETRSWGTRHRGPLAIHAAQSVDGGMAGLAALIETEPFRRELLPHLSGYTPEERAADLPRGGIVAVVTVTDCLQIDVATVGEVDEDAGPLEKRIDREQAFGDYRWGRYVWLLDRNLNIHDPILCQGHLGLWTVPEDARRRLVEITDLAMTPEEYDRYMLWCNQDQDGPFDRAAAISKAVRG